MKKIISLILALIMLVSTVALSAVAQDNTATVTVKVSNKADLVKTREVNYDSSKEDIAMILVIGQSNSTYGVGYEDELKDVANGNFTEVSEKTATPKEGTVFSSLQKKAITELNSENDVSTLIESISFGGFSAALGKTWYEKTGQKVVLVQASVGSTCLHRWLPDQTGYTCNCGIYTQTHYQDAVEAFTESYNALKEQYNIVHTGYIWNQGENDENRSRYEETTIDTTEEYYDAYKVMHNSFMSDLPLDFGSIAVVRSHFKSTSMHFTLAREAQYKLCNDLDNLCMASRIFETCTDDDMHMTSAGSSGIHALQKTYNRVGVDSANNMLEFISELDAPKFTTVSVFNQDGTTAAKFNQEGTLIDGNDVFTSAQTLIPFVDSITNKNKVEFVAQDGIIDAYGNILATAFDTYDSVRLECEFEEDVEMDSELVTGTTAPEEYTLSFTDFDFEDVTTAAEGSDAFTTMQHSDGTALTTSRSLVTGDKIDFTSKISVPEGKYKVVLQYRAYTGRAKVDITMGDSVYKSFVSATSGGTGTTADLFSEYVHETNGPVNITFDAVSDGLFYIEALILTKTGDAEETESSSSTTTTTTTTPVVESDSYKWNLYTDNFTFNADHTMNQSSNGKPFLNNHYANDGTYFFSSNNVVGNSVTLTSKVSIVPGTYSAKIYARASGSRAAFDLTINGVKVATNLYTGGMSGAAAYNVPFDLTENTITITEPSQIVLDFVVTDVSKSGNLYLNAIELTKVGDAEETSSTSTTTTTTATTTTTTTVPEESTSTPIVEATEYEFLFWSGDVALSDNTMGVKFGTQSGYKNFYSSAVSAGTSVTLTTLTDVEPGVYDASIFARTLKGAGRATVDIEINGVVVATGIDSTTAAAKANYEYPVDSITINKAGPVVIKFTATTDGSLYMNSLALTKTADVTPTISVATDIAASIRLNAQTGIRFYTEINNDEIESYKAVGYTVELGTLIAPADKVIGELTFDSETYADVKFEATNEDGTFNFFTQDDFTGVVGSIVNIKDKNLGRDFIGRGYVKLTKDGVTTIVYSNTVSTRSAKYIATAITAVDGWEADYSEEIVAMINKWANVADYVA